jgi:glycosyltransferase involved in cell wall biosynthesis
MPNSEQKIIKVLMVAPALPLIGGQVVQSSRLIENFRGEANLQVDLQPINPKFFPNLQKINYVRTVLTETKYIFDLLRKIPRYDVIHIFSASYFSFMLAPTPAVLISKLFGKKTILNYRSGEAEDHLKKWRTAIPTIRFFDKIVMPSGYLVDIFAKFDLEAVAIYNFVKTENYEFKERKPLRPVFLSNRNFEPLYNVACTLRAFAIIQQKFPEAKIFVAGDGSEKENLHNLAKELNLKNVEFMGRVSPLEMPKFYDKADIYLNSPNIDNMPNSIIEAYAAGTPVVSTNAGGIPYILEHEKTGLLAEVNDHENLAKLAIRLLENDSLAQSIIKNARELTAKFSWENARREWLKIYTELAEKK